jgi:hypothetical protein
VPPSQPARAPHAAPMFGRGRGRGNALPASLAARRNAAAAQPNNVQLFAVGAPPVNIGACT